MEYKTTDKFRETQKKFYEANKAKVLARRKELYHQRHKEHKQLYYKEQKLLGKLTNTDPQLKYYRENKKELNEKQRIRHLKMYKENIQFKVKTLMRTKLNGCLSKGGFTHEIESILGINYAGFKYYLESRFYGGMSWANRSGWHIDHIIPVSNFDLTDEAQLKKGYHFLNLQPLWSLHNKTKAKGMTVCGLLEYNPAT